MQLTCSKSLVGWPVVLVVVATGWASREAAARPGSSGAAAAGRAGARRNRPRRIAVPAARAPRLRQSRGLDFPVRWPFADRLERQPGCLVSGQRRYYGSLDRRAARRLDHIIWTGGEPREFELKLEIKLGGDIHSGIAYRSYVDVARGLAGRQGAAGGRGGASPAAPAVPADPKWTLYGPGLDFDYDRKMAGNVEDRGTPRREVAWRGGMAHSEPGQRPRLIGAIGDPDALMALIKADDWNQVHIIARGHQLTHIINGQIMTVLIETIRRSSGPAG